MKHFSHVRIHRMKFLIGALGPASNVPAMARDFNRPSGSVRMEGIDELPILPVDIGMNRADNLRGSCPRARLCVCR